MFITFQTTMALGTVGGLSVALPTITDEFDTNIATTVWVMLAYSLALAGGTFAMGKATTLLEKRKLITIGLAADVALLVFIFYTHNIYLFIGARFLSAFFRIYPWMILQVMGVGGFPPNKRGKVLGIMGVVQGLGIMLSIPIAGFVTEYVGWRWLFMGSAWAFALQIVLVWLVLPRLDPPKDAPPLRISQFDIPGSSMMMMGVVSLLAGLQIFIRGSAQDIVIILSVAAAISLGAFIWIETHTKTPIVPFAVFKIRGVLRGTIQAVTAGWMTGSLQLLLPFLFVVGFGWSVAYAASIMFFMGVGRPVARFVGGWASDRYGNSAVIVTAGLIAAVGQILISTLHVDPAMAVIISALLLIGLGQAAMQTANQRQIFNSIPAGQLHLAPSVSLVLTTSGSSIGLAFVGAALGTGVSTDAVTGIANVAIIDHATTALHVVTVVLLVGLATALILPRFLPKTPESEEATEDQTPKARSS